MKKIVVLWVALLCSLSSFSQSYHADYKTVNMHSPFRWVVADSTARVALTVTARDTQKLCFQIADTTIWLLSDDSPKRWTWVSGKKVDSLFVSNGLKATRVTADSATIPVLKGHTTKRDSTTFTGGIRGVRLSMDSIFNLTGTAGYVQYLSNSKKLINAPIYTNGTNVAIGKNSVEAWGGQTRGLQIGGNTAIMAMVNEEGQNNSWLLNNCYYDGTWKPYVSGDAARFVLGTSGFEWTFNSGLTADTQFTVTKIMTLSTGGVLNLPSLTASRAVVTDGSKNVVSSAVTSTELGYLSGVTSALQTQLDGKLTKTYQHSISASVAGSSLQYRLLCTIQLSTVEQYRYWDIKWIRIFYQTQHVANMNIHIENYYLNTRVSCDGYTYNDLLYYYINTTTKQLFLYARRLVGDGSGQDYLTVTNSNVPTEVTFNTVTAEIDDPGGLTEVQSVLLNDGAGLRLSNLTGDRALISTAGKHVYSSPTTATELALLSGKNSVIDGSGTAGNIPVFTGTGRIGNGPAYNSGTGTITGSISGNAATATTATNVSGGTMSGTSLTLNGGDPLSVYDTGSFPCSLKVGDFSSAATFTATYSIIGNKMFLYLQEFLWPSNSTQCRFYTGYTFNIPTGQSGTVGQYISCAVNTGIEVVAGFAHVINGSKIITLINPGGSFASGGAYKGLAAGVTLPITLN